MKNFLNFVKSDLVQAKIINKNDSFSFLKFLYLFGRSRICRIHAFIRLRSSNSFFAYIAKKYLESYFIEIGTNTKIGQYFYLPHPRCIIIANNVIIGEHVHVGQYVTIGGNFKKTKICTDGTVQKLPKIGSRVMIHPGAVIGGPVTIGNDIIIGANSVVTKDINSNSIVYGQNQLSTKKIIIPPEGGSYISMESEK